MYQIGAVVSLADAERHEIEKAQKDIASLREDLGSLREEYLAKEAKIFEALQKSRSVLYGKLTAAAASHAVDFSDPEVCWKWHPDRLVFERVK